MTALTITTAPDIFYPSGDGEPVAETFDHLYALLITLEVLRQYLAGQQATVLGNQFLYYAQGFPRLRTAPDVMVIFNVEPGGRDNYKIWEEGEVPRVIFEITSASTRHQDEGFKKTLYEQLGVQEYWQFDPKGEWIAEQLRGYRLLESAEPVYVPITDGQSQPLQLRLKAEGRLISFYRLDTGEKLLIPAEQATALQAERQRSQALAEQLDRYRQQFGELSEN
uniref:Putative restriction endonuclease domain-containing protein n=1 Tax=Cyanothece sp. (strain PCC 7425 / ATCC 29141) TaxID=395961 RepID=B8HUU4_CYAP4